MPDSTTRKNRAPPAFRARQGEKKFVLTRATWLLFRDWCFRGVKELAFSETGGGSKWEHEEGWHSAGEDGDVNKPSISSLGFVLRSKSIKKRAGIQRANWFRNKKK
ncbi:hypothetical protein NPIL_120591 [Nephila pilipes]|uniref:Uncharacterized protein n=1 Tax=Nephila pilipes TaxID=299642 RepID=A0A8X6MP75_NEPPI|nr:hypothetical protein NPIL_120591 [Nephila pilipes]